MSDSKGNRSFKVPNGWIKFYRKITEWEWYTDANTMRVFTHLLLNANHVSSVWRNIEIKPGQVVFSRRKLAKKLRLSERQTRTAISHLESTHDIAIHTTHAYTLATLLKWDKYQGGDEITTKQTTQKAPAKRPTTPRKTPQQTTTNKNIKKNKEDKEDIIYGDLFEECWSLYPKKLGKGKISETTKKKRAELGDEFKRCIERYKKSCEIKKTEKQFMMHGSTFWNSGYVDYLDDNYQEPTIEKSKSDLPLGYRNTREKIYE